MSSSFLSLSGCMLRTSKKNFSLLLLSFPLARTHSLCQSIFIDNKNKKYIYWNLFKTRWCLTSSDIDIRRFFCNIGVCARRFDIYYGISCSTFLQSHQQEDGRKKEKSFIISEQKFHSAAAWNREKNENKRASTCSIKIQFTNLWYFFSILIHVFVAPHSGSVSCLNLSAVWIFLIEQSQSTQHHENRREKNTKHQQNGAE